MKHPLLQLLLLAAVPAAAQTVVSFAPARHTLVAPRGAAVTALLSAPAGPGAAVRVLSAQAGGRKAGTATASGNAVGFQPTQAFRPGETVTAVLSGPTSYVWQFTAATGRATGVFGGGSDVNLQNDYGIQRIAPGDFDNDGDLDALLVRRSGSPTLMTNDGTGRFVWNSASLPGANNPSEVAVGDIDGDGSLDVVACATRPYTIEIGRNTGSGTFLMSSLGNNPITTALSGLTLVDVDGDADLDLCYANFVGARLEVVLNDGTGNFSTSRNSSTSPLGGAQPQFGDIDNDGDIDALVFNQNAARTMQAFLNSGNGTFVAGGNFAVSTYNGATVLGDVDGDGDLDLVSGDYGLGNRAHLYLNNGTGTFAPGPVLPTATAVSDLSLGDVDGDGDLDLLAGGTLNLNAGNGTFTPTTTPSAYGSRLALADLNGDGTLDLLAATINSSSHDVLQARLNGVVSGTRPSAAAALQAWPNPVASGELFMALPGAGPARATLRTLLGQELRALSFRGGVATLATTGLASGVYLLTVQAEGQAPVTRRVVVE